MRNPIQKFRQSSIVFEKPGFLSDNLKNWTISNYTTVQYFCGNFAHVSYLPMSIKGCSGSFLFCLYLELFANTKKDLVSTNLFFTFLLIIQDLNKIKKKLEHTFVTIVKQEPCAKCQLKILNFVVVGARQSFHFFRQIAWFLRNNRALPKFRYRILYNLISIAKL